MFCLVVYIGIKLYSWNTTPIDSFLNSANLFELSLDKFFPLKNIVPFTRRVYCRQDI